MDKPASSDIDDWRKPDSKRRGNDRMNNIASKDGGIPEAKRRKRSGKADKKADNNDKIDSPDGNVYNKNDPFCLLSDELLLIIFSYLKKDDLAKRVCLVSRRFRNVSYDPSLWTNLTFSWNRQSGPPMESATALFRRRHHLELLEVDMFKRKDNYYAFPVATKALEECPKLGRLTVFGDADFGLVETLLAAVETASTSASFKSLLLVGKWDPAVLSTKASCLRRLTGLGLCIYGSEFRLSDASLIAIGKTCKSLQVFQLDVSVSFTPDTMLTFFNEIHSTIRELTFNRVKLIDEDLSGLEQCQQLRKFRVQNDMFLYGRYLREQVSKLAELTHLKLTLWDPFLDGYRTYVSQAKPMDFIKMFENGNLRNLKSLELASMQGVRPGVLVAVAKNCPKLELLDLSYCGKLTDFALGAIVRKCRRLNTLMIQTPWAGVTSMAFRNASPSLRRLAIDSTFFSCIDKEELVKIKKMLPGMEIVDAGGEEWSYEKHGRD